MTGAYQFDRDVRVPEKVFYALGDAGFNFVWVMYDSFLLYFLVDIVGLPAASLTPIVLCSRLADLLVCVLFGMLGDRVRTRYGTYRPYMACLALPLSLAFALVFTLPTLHAAPQSLVLWTGAAAILFCVLYSAGNTAYTALLGVLTEDVAIRLRLATLRFAFAAIAVLVVQFFAIRLANTFGGTDSARGWSWVAALCAIACVALLGVSAAGTRERLEPAPALSLNLKRIATDIANESGLGWLAFAMVFCVAALSCRGAASPFYLRALAGDDRWTGPIMATNSLAASIACMVLPAVGPKRWLTPLPLGCACAALGAFLCLSPLLWHQTTYVELLALQACFGASTGLLIPALFTLMASPSQRKLIVLTPALLAAVTLIALKTGSAIGALIASSTIARSGRFASSSPGSLHGVEHLFTLLPAMLFALSLCCLLVAQSRRHAEVNLLQSQS